MLFLDETGSLQYQKLESPDHRLEKRATNDKKLAKSHWDNFSEDTGVLAQLGGSTCPQMSSEELSLSLSSLFCFCGFAVVGSAISISDSILICLWIVR